MEANKENFSKRVCGSINEAKGQKVAKKRYDNYSLSEIRTLPKPILYHLAQIQRTKVILVLDLSSNRDILEKVPLLIAINLQNTFLTPIYRPFDKFHVTSYSMAVIGGEEQPMQLFKNTTIREWWRNERIISTAHAEGYRIVSQAPEKWTPGFVQYAKEQKQRTSAASKMYLDVVARGMVNYCRLYDYQIKTFKEKLPEPRSLIEVKVAVLPEGQLEFENYFLPEKFVEENGHVINKSRTYAIEARNYSANDPRLKNYPYEDRAEKTQQTNIRSHEEVLLASAMLAQNRVKEAFLSTRYAPETLTVKVSGVGKQETATMKFKISPPKKEDFDQKLLSKRLRFWTPETVLRFEPTEVNPRLEKTGLKAVITEAILFDNMEIEIMCKLNSDQLNLAREKASDLFDEEKTTSYMFYPDADNTGYETAIRYLKYKKLSNAIEDNENSGRKQILEMLLGRKTPQEIAEGKEMDIDLPGKKFRLSATQSIPIRSTSILKNRVIFQQAPAGTGKTLVTALCVWKWLQTSEELILAIAPTNHAVQNLAKAFFSISGSLDIGKVLFLQSTNAEVLETQEEDECWKNCRIPELLDHFYTNQEDCLSRVERKQMRSYIDMRLSHDGSEYRKKMAFELLLNLVKPRIIFGTVSMATAYIDRLEEKEIFPQFMAIDEAGLLSNVGLLALTSSLSKIQQIFLTGDVKQLPAYTGALPEKIIPFGHEGSIHTIDSRMAIKKITLTELHRSHPVLVEALERAIYKDCL